MQVSMSEEVKGSEFGDIRLSRRLERITEEFGAKPNFYCPSQNLFVRQPFQAADDVPLGFGISS